MARRSSLLPADPGADPARLVQHARIARLASYVSPIALYSDGAALVLDPFRKTTRSLILMGPLERISLGRFERPLPLGQSVLVVTPHLVSLVALTLACFGICYAAFLRQEIRST